jgi:hypothetical protein
MAEFFTAEKRREEHQREECKVRAFIKNSSLTPNLRT